MRAMRRLRKHWKPFWVHAWRHKRTWSGWGRMIVSAGILLARLLGDPWPVYAMLLGLLLLFLSVSVCHWVRCYRASLRPEDDKDKTGGDRFVVYTAEDIWRHSPWLRK